MANVGRGFGIVSSLFLLLGGCDSTEQSEDLLAGPPCSVPASESATAARDDVIVVRGDDAPCAIAFEPVQTISGSLLNGTLPRPPITVAPGGRWLTATYEDGEVAVWSPSGKLERLIGRGPGEGPGEFGRVRELIVDSLAGTIHVFPQERRVVVYSLDGDYLDWMPLPTYPTPVVRLSDGTLAMSGTRGSSKIWLMIGDSVFETGPAARISMPGELRAGDEGVWTAEAPWYQFDHHMLPSGQVDWSIRREVDWFPKLSDEEGREMPGPLLLGFTIDSERRLVFSRVELVKDPDAPSSPIPARVPLAERDEVFGRYYDGVVEAFTLDGELVASTRLDDWWHMPRPIEGGAPGNFWYRLIGDEESIEILKPTLVEKPR